MTTTFQPFDVPGAQTVHGNAFPYGLEIHRPDGAASSGVPTVDDAVTAIASLAESGRLSELLQRHGAVLIHGIGHPSAETFARLVNAAEKARGSHPFEQIGLAGKRTLVAENVWTANEGPSDRRFYQHNEYSRYTRFPSNIHFYCQTKAPRGGQTPIAHSALVYERLQCAVPALVHEVHQRGLAMKMVFRAPGHEGRGNEFNWAGEHSFGQEFEAGDDRDTQKAKVEAQVRRLTPSFRWLKDDTLELTQHIPGIQRAPASGRPVWFNGLVGRYGMTRDLGALEPPYLGRDGMTYLPCDYGDGTVIPAEYVQRLEEVVDRLEIDLCLEEGNLLLVDNFQVSHGRKPWTGDRRILVSMWANDQAPIEAF
ncbi:Clavaminate synthase-like protein [Aspergillus fijiensis CBS 313.89]|uniref:Clavaminate synthase-like protein n=1 Tax=Aspergillus fijiensis CBS 313.89 TaxID=1448319 RepID=A0A8G1S2J0_9EURO|nr:Clavaminate synthase-like protein [Aspergillus fijiensis CBS 313.89]RAK82240.1 Clavaminate synthase-like protein [Aspergillus fijiensis CBS 313.89]